MTCAFGFRVARVTEREDQTRATDQQGKTTTEAADQGSYQSLHVGFIDAELQQKNIDKWKQNTFVGRFSPFRSFSFIAAKHHIAAIPCRNSSIRCLCNFVFTLVCVFLC